ncbi:MAG: glutamyl-Q tRNA(Asp) synthetase [Lentisphaeria bacterium]|jgi:glutamyl-Q tRNA(Asp) synthetase
MPNPRLPSAPTKQKYIGRFAPSPSGPLHIGSLTCALASFLDARANSGIWQVRIEDIDPPREQTGASASILNTLGAHQLLWDGSVSYQSKRSDIYKTLLADLEQRGLTYRCNCTRKRLATLASGYDGKCRYLNILANTPSAIRLNIGAASATEQSEFVEFNDAIQGKTSQRLAEAGDFIVLRKDNLFSYQLAVVADDIAQNITHVMRGSDLLDTTCSQIFLTRLAGHTPPDYAHIPVIRDCRGLKLSKQNHAPGVDANLAQDNLYRCLHHLKQNPPKALKNESIDNILKWAIQRWQPSNIPKCNSVTLEQHFSARPQSN